MKGGKFMKRSRVCNTAQVKTSCHTSVSNDVETLVKKPLHICKKVDKEEACQGETLTYTIKIKNPSLVKETQVVFSDYMVENVEYVEDSFYVNGHEQTPAIDNHTLYYVIPSIDPMSTVEIVFQVRITE